MLNANEVGNTGMKKELLDAGVYPGRLVGVIDLGMQEQREFKGEPKPPQYELMLTYEFADEFMKDEEGNDLPDKPRWLSETMPFFNLGAERAKSTLRYHALDPTEQHGGAWAELLGTACNITIIINAGRGKNVGKTYENIAGISTMRPKDIESLPDLVNPSRVFDLGDPDLEVFASLPEWIRDKIKSNLEFKGSLLSGLLEDEGEPTKEQVYDEEGGEEDKPGEDEIPF